MAWNEPGGNNQDPWGGGNKGNNQGPPDLDEAFKKLQSQLAGIFGGGRGGDGGGGGAGINSGMLGVILVIAAVLYGAFGVYQLDAQERGVVFRFGELQQDIVMPGLHWNPPLIDRVIVENVTRVRSRPHDQLDSSLRQRG